MPIRDNKVSNMQQIVFVLMARQPLAVINDCICVVFRSYNFAAKMEKSFILAVLKKKCLLTISVIYCMDLLYNKFY